MTVSEADLVTYGEADSGYRQEHHRLSTYQQEICVNSPSIRARFDASVDTLVVLSMPKPGIHWLATQWRGRDQRGKCLHHGGYCDQRFHSSIWERQACLATAERVFQTTQSHSGFSIRTVREYFHQISMAECQRSIGAWHDSIPHVRDDGSNGLLHIAAYLQFSRKSMQCSLVVMTEVWRANEVRFPVVVVRGMSDGVAAGRSFGFVCGGSA